MAYPFSTRVNPDPQNCTRWVLIGVWTSGGIRQFRDFPRHGYDALDANIKEHPHPFSQDIRIAVEHLVKGESRHENRLRSSRADIAARG